jgi:hypothetical protein
MEMRKSVLLMASMGLALFLASGVAWAALVPAAVWKMNERSGPMIDSSGNRNHGDPKYVERTGTNYVFNGSTSRVKVPDDNSLDPQERDIRITATVKVAGRTMDDDSYDVVRKGIFGTSGGDYKMEISRGSKPSVGRLKCTFRGHRGVVETMATEGAIGIEGGQNATASPDIVDRNWHTLTCIKTDNTVVARVGSRSYTNTGSAGSISNSKEVLIGAKTTNPRDDMFDGKMGRVSIEIAQ